MYIVFVKQISCTALKFPFKLIAAVGVLKTLYIIQIIAIYVDFHPLYRPRRPLGSVEESL